MSELSSLAREINAVDAIPVPDVFIEQCFLLGYSRSLMTTWQNLPADQVWRFGWQAMTFRVGLMLATAMEDNRSLAYHNRTHAAETLVAARWLINHQYGNDCLLEREQGLRLLTAMSAHDLDYECIDHQAPMGTAEAHSAGLLAKAFDILDPNDDFTAVKNELVAVILGTEPVHGPTQNSLALQENPGSLSVQLRVLANEADVLASILMETGLERGARLAREWKDRGQPLADQVASVEGRRHFLLAQPLASQAAEAMGLRQVRDLQAS